GGVGGGDGDAEQRRGVHGGDVIDLPRGQREVDQAGDEGAHRSHWRPGIFVLGGEHRVLGVIEHRRIVDRVDGEAGGVGGRGEGGGAAVCGRGGEPGGGPGGLIRGAGGGCAWACGL